MIIQTGLRTDIPAFYSRWFMNRIRAGFVMVRNPYNFHQVTRYRLDPEVVDLIGFCTKNPAPMLSSVSSLGCFSQYWFVSIIPYGTDLEPYVPPVKSVVRSVIQLASVLPSGCVALRYDPVVLTSVYTEEVHYKSFDSICRCLKGSIDTAAVSFISEYPKHQYTFPQLMTVPVDVRRRMIVNFTRIASGYGITVKLCGENFSYFSDLPVKFGGCLTYDLYEKVIGYPLKREKYQRLRSCDCVMGHDIGTYNSCLHMCRYCYANYLEDDVKSNAKRHNENSPLLIGEILPEDRITSARQSTLKNGQNSLF
jgi:hypothetical protein